MDHPELFAERASSFGANAAVYAEHRPDYPLAAIEWVLGGRKSVLDLAAGTGLLSDGLVRLGCSVTAVEPDPAMRAELARRQPAVTALDGTAESIAAEDGSFDAVVAGQAFHWFNTPEALTEITRVLRPGGVLGLFWNRDDVTVPWMADLAEATTTSIGPALVVNWMLPEHERLAPAEHTFVPHGQARTIESFIATIGTHSQVALAPPAERAALLDDVRAYLRSRPETASGDFIRPLSTVAVRAVRL
ncbi:Methyltransferase domain-containing protein [Actinokineospora alba]|uniref:Methyltransferase domain-containing protein n=1 Tax=Actinokineospora alba TaxID=504798 RepID=A0A1H0SV11_9PSEU|nr:class I SAM-dependent methyltransferase [Actinokineospora alba]TDP66520.1 methyltransferase family protein [Actinokineospora alba]SDJ36876.1 Methyltransferase domain-containing protein [Actinokineospora alba]SDP45597.1 Methyltransferase domain-containing protein [Actinokineospora alba]